MQSHSKGLFPAVFPAKPMEKILREWRSKLNVNMLISVVLSNPQAYLMSKQQVHSDQILDSWTIQLTDQLTHR